jgi:uncharacterized protein (DUF427 family)
MKASWKDQLLAESEDTVIVESNHYFPISSINREFFSQSDTTSHCPWKGDASYYSIVVDGHENRDAAWYYPSPMDAAREIEGRVAFWRGVEISE